MMQRVVVQCPRYCQSKFLRPCQRRQRPAKFTTMTAIGQTINICQMMLMILCICWQGSLVECLSITNLDIPNPIVNGTMSSVILDCDFQYNSNDTVGLVIKWYYNNSNHPIYQWIQGSQPQALGEFQQRLDLNHKISEDPYTEHRALRLLWPTVEFSGNYMCKVQSMSSEDRKNKTLVVYVPAERLEINMTKPSDNSVNVSCISEGGYPEPILSLHIYLGDSKQSEPADNFRVFQQDGDGDGQMDVVGYRVFEDKYFSVKEVIFECVSAIADTNYKENKRLAYYPGLSSTPRPLSHTNSQVLLTAFISTESSLVDISKAGPRVASSSSHLLTITTTIMSIISTTFMFLRCNSFRS